MLFRSKVIWVGFKRENYAENRWLDAIGLQEEHWTIDMARSVHDHSYWLLEENRQLHSGIDKLRAFEKHISTDSVLFIELRPNEDKPGYNFKNEWEAQTYLINLFHSKGLPVFVWDQDVWAQHIPLELRSKMILLRSYFNSVPDFPNQELFLYGWTDFSNWFTEKMHMTQRLRHLARSYPKKFDIVYCGNVYGRRNEFLEFFKPFNDTNKRVCIQGNWLRKKYDDQIGRAHV